MKQRNRRGNGVDSRIFVLARKDRVNTYLSNTGTGTTSTLEAKTFTGYIDAKDYRKTLPEPKNWLIERIS